jgi:hypothetical protein
MIWFLQSEQGYEEEEDEQMPSLDVDDEVEEADRDSDEEARLEEEREKRYEWRFKKIEDVQVSSWEEDDRKRAVYAHKHKQRLQARELQMDV